MNTENAQAVTLKQKAAHELVQLFAIFLYLAFFFCALATLLAAIYKALLFTLLVFAFHVVEELIRLLIHKGNMATALREIRIDDLLSRSLVVFCTFIPLFAFRELQRVLGEEKFRALFFRTLAPEKSDLTTRT
jgi:hypothetical protein